jgi:hypothetical protein
VILHLVVICTDVTIPISEARTLGITKKLPMLLCIPRQFVPEASRSHRVSLA